ncbi:hypothetical protein N0V83_010466 [Neocucurbitaria cava]|uniref:lytic cellulose monooxygenase (C4-dehydrogenating) n=1 Tax=Neocucurbitaria cava TaxID=798079 RepID=A0A9W8XYK1_9PLEO|nr:hypothetical protein N0V83_010466 [Neocucurbitaria cava]
MKPFNSNLTFLLLLLQQHASTALAHWNYDRIIVNGAVIGSPYQYIRRTNNSNTPLQNVNSTDMRCNAGAASGVPLNTSTYTVAAGDTLGFTLKDTFGHPGPQQVYISRAPGTGGAVEYDGSGEWARIYSLTSAMNASKELYDGGVIEWATHKARTFNFRLPAELQAGEYLVRAEGLALHAAHKPNCAQFYVACAQIRVVSSAATREGGGVPGPNIRFPGGYQWDSEGVLIPEFWSRLADYTAPGPKLWPEGSVEAHVLDGVRKVGAD